jgi:hypothetical protein
MARPVRRPHISWWGNNLKRAGGHRGAFLAFAAVTGLLVGLMIARPAIALAASRPPAVLVSIKGPTDDRISPEAFLKKPENRDIDRKSVDAALAASGQIRCFDGKPSIKLLRYKRKKGSTRKNLSVLMTNPTPMVNGDNGFLFYSNQIVLTAAHTFEGLDFHHCVFVAMSAHTGQRFFYAIKEVKAGTTDSSLGHPDDYALAVLDAPVSGVTPLINADKPVHYGDRIINLSVATSNRPDPSTNNDPTMVSCRVKTILGGTNGISIYSGGLCDDGPGSSGSGAYAIEDNRLVLKGLLIRSGRIDYQEPRLENQTDYLEIGPIIRQAADELSAKYSK